MKKFIALMAIGVLSTPGSAVNLPVDLLIERQVTYLVPSDDGSGWVTQTFSEYFCSDCEVAMRGTGVLAEHTIDFHLEKQHDDAGNVLRYIFEYVKSDGTECRMCGSRERIKNYLEGLLDDSNSP